MRRWKRPSPADVEARSRRLDNRDRRGRDDRRGTANPITPARRAGVRVEPGAHLAIPFPGLAGVDGVDPEGLAAACREEGRHEGLVTAAPLRLVGATGAPVHHPLAIF